MFDWPRTSADLTPIEDIMKKKFVKLPNNKKRALE